MFSSGSRAFFKSVKWKCKRPWRYKKWLCWHK